MTRAIKADYTKILLFPRAVEDWVGEDHPARFVREVVEALPLEDLGLAQREVGSGRPHYSEELLLKAWLYGYMNGIRSQRQLERACRENVGLIWLLGQQEPDHNTLWRFWKRNRESIGKVFRQVVRIANAAGIVRLMLHAVDGTKIQAWASSRRGRKRSGQELELELEALNQLVEQIEGEIESRSDGDEPGCRLPQELASQEQLRQKVRQALLELEESGRDQINPHEPEARVMVCEGEKKLSYNAQVVADQASGMLVAERVVQAEQDSGQLIPMLEEAEANLGSVAQETVADKGYRSDQAVGEAEAKDYAVLVPLYDSETPGTADPFHKCHFRHEEEADVVICPRGQELVFEGHSRQSRQGWKQRVYRCQVGAQCPVAQQCSRSPRGRTVAIGPYHAPVVRQRERQAQPDGQDKLRQRKVIAEPPFAHIKHNMGFRRWTFLGLEAVQAQWSMVCTAYNLKKLMRYWLAGELQLTG